MKRLVVFCYTKGGKCRIVYLLNGASEKVALHVAAQKACGVVDRYWREILPRFGYEYIKMKGWI